MTNTLKCTKCNIVIDELLAYIQNKVSIADELSLVRICSSSFSCEQIEKSNNLLLESLPSDVRKTIRRGKGKENRLLNDIINLFKVTDPDVLPVFVARDLEKLPPITFDHLDVSKLLKDLIVVQEEIKNIKCSYATIEQLKDLKRECLNGKLPSPPFSAVKVNMKRGAYRDSGPIGLSHLDDNMSTPQVEKINSEPSSLKEYQLNYRNINIKEVEGRNETFQSNSLSQRTADRCVTNGNCDAERNDSGKNESSQMNNNSRNQSTAQKQSYASAVRVQNANDEWTVVTKKSYKSKNRLVGKMGNVVVESEEKFRAAEKKIPLLITNVHKNTKESDIINYIQNKTKENVTLEKISIKRQCEHDAYKLFVSHCKLPLYLDENLWPQGIIFRRFVHFKHKRTTETSPTEVALNKLPPNNG